MDSIQQPCSSTNQCSICTQEAHGIHFGVYSCRACAAFFRRCMVLKTSYTCKKAGNCEVNKIDRFFCRACRLEKCLALGMTEENVQLNRDKMTSVVTSRSKSPRETSKNGQNGKPKEIFRIAKGDKPFIRPLPPATFRKVYRIFEEKLISINNSDLSGLSLLSSQLKNISADQSDEIEHLRMDSIQQPCSSTKQCSICTQEAHGIHFGVYSCRACAAFFRRCIVLKISFTCKKAGNCEVNKNDRHFCRACRLAKCLARGMTEKNVQLNRDKMTSVVSSRSKSPRETSKNGQNGHPKEIIRIVKGDRPFIRPLPPRTFRKVYRIFEEESSSVNNSDMSGLSLLSSELKNISADQSDAIEVLPILDYSNHMSIWEEALFRQARWILNCQEFAQLDTDTKMALFAKSWTCMMRLERLVTTVRRIGEEVFTRRLIYAFDRFAVDEKTQYIPINNPQANGETVRRIFMSSFNTIIDELCRPIFEMNLTDEEVTFILLQILWHVEGSSVEQETLGIADKAREKLSSELHKYYQKRKMENYADRLVSLLLLIKEAERIHKERNKMFELARVFNYFGEEKNDG